MNQLIEKNLLKSK